jgi:hypothetical protein
MKNFKINFMRVANYNLCLTPDLMLLVAELQIAKISCMQPKNRELQQGGNICIPPYATFSQLFREGI